MYIYMYIYIYIFKETSKHDWVKKSNLDLTLLITRNNPNEETSSCVHFNQQAFIVMHHTRQYRKEEGRNCFLHRFQQLRSYRHEIETPNQEEIPFSL